ncbi:MAG TPA: Hsp20/alpha crystallin family protein [Puia sp.]|nr:Hsp20/alpha crystallin family protein [Puia sp.]
MATKALTRVGTTLPSVFDDFFRPWNEWLDNGVTWRNTLTVPAVNVAENKDEFVLTVAAPGMKKDDFQIDVQGNMLTISSEKEEKKEDKDANYTRKEYSYASFSRTFTLPDEINREKIEAHYEDGVLRLALPKKDEAKKITASKHISVK